MGKINKHWPIAGAIVVGAGILVAGALFIVGTVESERRTERRVAEQQFAVPVGIQEIQNSFREISARLLPSVVTISAVQTQERPTNDTRPPWFDFFFGQPEDESPPRQEFRSRGFGSGVIVSRDGDTYYVITNAHVVGNAQELEVVLTDGEEIEAALVGSDPRKDLALLSFMSPAEIPVAPLGDSDTLHVGDWVLAIGSPFNFQSTVTAGIVSALGRRGGPQGNINDFIQTDAAINRGNSGGALININGEVIGINTWISSSTGVNVGLGFAIPINNVKKPIDDFISQGAVEYGWLGISISSISEQIAESLQVPGSEGALVLNVFRDSPADRAGIQPGDFVVEIDGNKIENSDELLLIVGDLPVSRNAEIVLYREGARRVISVRITARESESDIANQNSDLWPGMRVTPLTEEVRERLGIAGGVRGVYVDSVEELTPVAIGGIRVGDVITHINDEPTDDLMGFYRALNNKKRGRVEFRLSRRGQEISIGIVK